MPTHVNLQTVAQTARKALCNKIKLLKPLDFHVPNTREEIMCYYIKTVPVFVYNRQKASSQVLSPHLHTLYSFSSTKIPCSIYILWPLCMLQCRCEMLLLKIPNKITLFT